MPDVYTAGAVTGFITFAAYRAYARGRRLEAAWRRALRSRRVELLAEEAVLDDPAFAPEVVKGAAAALHGKLLVAWTAQDRRGLAEMLGRELLGEWEFRLTELHRRGWTNPIRRRGRPRIRYVGLVNRTGDEEDRVVVHISARVRDRVYDQAGRVLFRDGNDKGRRLLSEYWTLAKRQGAWVLVSVETDWEGTHQLTDPLIPSPWADDRLHDTATLEQASASAIPAGELAGAVPTEFAADLRVAALDLASFDGRYDPDVLQASAQGAVAAWADAIDGNQQPLIDLLGHANVNELLHPDHDRHHRLVIRGPRLRQLRIAELRPKSRPPAMVVLATITGRRYLEHRANRTVLVGSRDHDSTFMLRCELTLSNRPGIPWRINSIRAVDGLSPGWWHLLTYELPLEVYDLMASIFDPARL